MPKSWLVGTKHHESHHDAPLPLLSRPAPLRARRPSLRRRSHGIVSPRSPISVGRTAPPRLLCAGIASSLTQWFWRVGLLPSVPGRSSAPLLRTARLRPCRRVVISTLLAVSLIRTASAWPLLRQPGHTHPPPCCSGCQATFPHKAAPPPPSPLPPAPIRCGRRTVSAVPASQATNRLRPAASRLRQASTMDAAVFAILTRLCYV